MEIIYCEETAKTPQSGYLDSNQGLAAYKAVALPSELHPVNGSLHPLAVIFIVPCTALSDFRVQQPPALPNEPSYIPSSCMQKATSRMSPSDGPLQIQGGMTLCTVLRPYTFVIIIITQVKRSERSNIIFLCQFLFQTPVCNFLPCAGVPFSALSVPNSENHPDT